MPHVVDDYFGYGSLQENILSGGTRQFYRTGVKPVKVEAFKAGREFGGIVFKSAIV
jgi:hypothetical protein